MKYEIESANNGWIVSWWDEGGEETFQQQHGFTYSQEPDRTDREELMEEIKCFSEMCRFLAEQFGLHDGHDDTHRLICAVVTQVQWDQFMDITTENTNEV